MNYTWNDFKIMRGGEEGARAAFEKVCESLFRAIHPDSNVQQVEVKQGDGGIDIFVGELGIKPVTVIQCKFFINGVSEAQKNQIRKSFDKAITSQDYEIEKWVLCIPVTLDLKPHKWWSNWKDQVTEKLNKGTDFIKLVNGNELIELLKAHGLYDDVFNIEHSKRINDIHKAVCSLSLHEMSDDEKNTYEESLLKAAYLMTKENQLLTSTHKRIFDTLLFVLIYDTTCIQKKKLSTRELQEKFSETINLNADRARIDAALSRTIRRNIVKEENGFLTITSEYYDELNRSDIDLSSDLDSLTNWVIEDLLKAIGYSLSSEQVSIIKENTIESIVIFHKLYAYGVLLENSDLSNGQLSTSIIQIAKHNLTDEISDELILIIGRLLRSPSNEQSVILDKIRKTYLGLQLLGLDPKVHSKRGQSFSGKNYILDTDFVLNIVAPHSLKSSSYRRIVDILIKNGATVKIPTEILEEVCYHAKYSNRTYYYFENAYNRLDQDLLLQKVGNVFVESYFNRPKNDANLTFDAYLRNLYDESNGVEFLVDLISDELSSEIEIITLENSLDDNKSEMIFLGDLEEGIVVDPIHWTAQG